MTLIHTEDAIALGRTMTTETALDCLGRRSILIEGSRILERFHKYDAAIMAATKAQLYREAVESYLERWKN